MCSKFKIEVLYFQRVWRTLATYFLKVDRKVSQNWKQSLKRKHWYAVLSEYYGFFRAVSCDNLNLAIDQV